MYKFNNNSIDVLNKIGEEEGFNVIFTTMSSKFIINKCKYI